ncbi:hypothetical protein P280DRAFT_22255 [Massarina eburnea CBS 473.64]|uniref:C2H2-type domain-containing protein n=1 Tax=Massarina eburnea CBS 473.64 TaxID=1395130 RepID=A0A6A6RX41_9PLEO|nr:hypothetical protein P280DRAFT_22255 [Massarina eburnea CBS 473.64]
MSVFQAVNTTLSVPDPPPGRPGDETTPTTPRPNSKFFTDPKSAEDASAKTPTRNSFAGLAAQRPLPSSPFTPSRELSSTPSRHSVSRENSHRSSQSVGSQDVEMGGGDDEALGSDDESVNGDSKQTSKKKKGQRFFCTDFPPCHLSFTRSEHLARHIRKHTGERPFQCHCSRRFSRLDNLRQHAQTVHVNEDIPGDSLAATGTRFQRQIRTDRVRPPGNRSRANTLGSTTGGHSRGHSRNLSTSSITSTASSISVAQSPDVRRRPPPLAMASEGTARARLSLSIVDSYNPPLMGSPGPAIVDYSTQSNGATTPTSATFSTATGSPSRFSSALQSPISSTSRPLSWSGAVPSGRRLSVPTSGNPFSGPPGQFVPSFITPLPSATSSTFSGQGSVYASPTISNFPESRRESNAEADWRRRTWHPGTYAGPRPATSGLGYYQNLDAPRPSFTSQPAASQTRLPGIESFDHAPPVPHLPRRQPSPMQVDAPPTRPVTYHAPTDPPPSRRNEKRMSISWDTTLQKGLNSLEIASPNPPREQWTQYQSNPVQSVNTRPTTAPHSGYLNQQPSGGPPQFIQTPPSDAARSSQDTPTTPKRNKRQAWYNGPLTHQAHSQPQPQPPVQAQPGHIQRTSPEDSSSSEGVPTPSSNSSMPEYHPAIVHSNGYVETHPPGAPIDEQKPFPRGSIMDRPHPIHGQYQQYQAQGFPSYRPQPGPRAFGQPLHQGPSNDMTRLDALVAVATGERQAVGDRP